MTNRFIVASIAALMLTSCTKKINAIVNGINVKTGAGSSSSSQFVLYTIAKGGQYCDKNGYQKVSYDQLTFSVKFDSSAIYQTVNASNQNDINKLYGFSDNNKQHHEFSARFGWRWSNNALRLFGYVYNNGTQSSKELGTVNIGDEVNCYIKVAGNSYIFSLNGQTTTMPRASTTTKAEGYKLYPYFGGDELAPHAIMIAIKEK